MTARGTVLLILAAATSGCAFVTRPLRWPAVFPDWEESPEEEYDPALKAEAIVAGFPSVAAAVRPQSETPDPPDPRPGREVRQEIEVATPPPEGSEEPPRPEFQSSTGLFQATVLGPDDAVVGRVADVLFLRQTGAVAGLIVEHPDEKPRFLATNAVSWSDGSAPPRALEAARADLRELFAAEDRVTISGQLDEIVLGAPPSGDAELRVRDADNLLYRVQIAAPELVLARLPELRRGDAISARAVPTRDPQGKVWIAASVGRGDATVRIRDDAGALLWTELAAAPSILHGLEGYSFDVDGDLYRITGWELMAEEPRVRRVQVARDGETLWMEWSEVAVHDPWK